MKRQSVFASNFC